MADYAVPVAGALVVHDGDVLLVDSPKWDGWTVPGGKVEHGDSLAETVRREVREETGLAVTDVEFLHAKDGHLPEGPDDDHYVYLDFVCRAENRAVDPDGREVVDYRWVDPEQALAGDLDLEPSAAGFVRRYLADR